MFSEKMLKRFGFSFKSVSIHKKNRTMMGKELLDILEYFSDEEASREDYLQEVSLPYLTLKTEEEIEVWIKEARGIHVYAIKNRPVVL